jgi:hypothetical protein
MASGRRGLRLAAIALLVLGVVTACATTPDGGRLAGSSGPVSWEVVDLRQRLSPDGRKIRWYFTVVLRETEGKTIQFERWQANVYGLRDTTPAESRFDRQLAPRSEVRLNYSPYLYSGTGGAMIVFYRYLGKDDGGRSVTVDVRIPLSGIVSRTMPSSAPPGPLPPVRSLQSSDLRDLAGTWRGYYRDGDGFEVPVEVIAKEDGSVQIAVDDPVTRRLPGTFSIRDGKVTHSTGGGESGTLTYFEEAGKKALEGNISGRREGAAPYAANFLLRLEWVSP